MATMLFAALCAAAVWLARRWVSRPGSARRRALRGAFIALLGLPAVYSFAVIGAALANNWRLHRFGRQVFDFPLPAGATETRREADVGVLTGNGNHCDFVVRRAFTSALSPAQVRAHFAPLRLRPAIAGGAGAGLPSVEVTGENGRYVVIAIDAPYELSFDPRCN